MKTRHQTPKTHHLCVWGKLTVLAVTLLTLSSVSLADQITFAFSGFTNSISANAAGLSLGPAVTTTITDNTTGVVIPFPNGTATGSTGAAASFVVVPGVVLANYNAGGVGSVSIVDSMGNAIVTGMMRDNASFLTTFPDGAAAFLSNFDVTFVSPTVLADFGLGPAFASIGSVSATGGQMTFSDGTARGVIGGGGVTILTPQAPVSEPGTWALLGSGAVMLVLWKRYKGVAQA